MAFTSKRGRPKSKSKDKLKHGRIIDEGTPELAAKRRQRLTAEAIDELLRDRVISRDMHRAAMHFRWLYTIKFGAPNITAVSLEHFYGREIKREENQEWLQEREAEYNQAMQELIQIKAYKKILNVAVFNHPPAKPSRKLLVEGLNLLVTIFRDNYDQRLGEINLKLRKN